MQKQEPTAPRRYRIPSKAAVGLTASSSAVMIVVEDYSHQWPKEFESICDKIYAALGNLVERIEHVGSTAVPSLAAKPIVDIDVVITSRDTLGQVIKSLAVLGYSHQGDLGITGREAFTTPEGATQHNLYVCDRDNAELCRHVIFRDYLRTHPEAVYEYGRLKKALALKYPNDRNAYTDAKTEFVSGILRMAAS